MKRLEFGAVDIHKGNLILVNPTHPLKREPADETLVSVRFGTTHILLERQAEKMLAEVTALLGCGHQIVPVSGYRTMDEQQTIYENSLRDYGKDFTQKYVAIPGCSEHQTGLAIDLAEKKEGGIDFIRPNFPYSGICQRFRKKSTQYGFIERYPAGQENITHIAHEPWHFRYVGYPHSALMTDKGVTLEEYTEYIKQFPYHGDHLRAKYNGRDFTIFYITLQSKQTRQIEIPDNIPFQLSGNNEDGVVVTLWEDWM